jgi:hypothetical protein
MRIILLDSITRSDEDAAQREQTVAPQVTYPLRLTFHCGSAAHQHCG